MTSTDACACHGNLGIGRTAVSDEVLERLKGVSIPTIEGVMAIPQAVAAQVAEAGLEAERRDAFSRSKVEAGYALAEAYPLSESLRAEYEARNARGGAGT